MQKCKETSVKLCKFLTFHVEIKDRLSHPSGKLAMTAVV